MTREPRSKTTHFVDHSQTLKYNWLMGNRICPYNMTDQMICSMAYIQIFLIKYCSCTSKWYNADIWSNDTENENILETIKHCLKILINIISTWFVM